MTPGPALGTSTLLPLDCAESLPALSLNAFVQVVPR